jgi:hypothetical protein
MSEAMEKVTPLSLCPEQEVMPFPASNGPYSLCISFQAPFREDSGC